MAPAVPDCIHGNWLMTICSVYVKTENETLRETYAASAGEQ